jgi:DedD protein
MALFKSRRGGGEEPVPPPSPSESIDVMRRRARHRLIGAVVLVAVGVVGFPLLFDTQPRPIAVDVPIEIPDRNKVKPLAPPPVAAVAPAAKVASGPVVAAAPTAPAAPTEAQKQPAPVAVFRPAEKTEKAEKPEAPAKPVKPEAKAEAKPEAKEKPEAREAKPADGAKALALLEGRKPDEIPVASDTARFVVQVGAYSDPVKAREARLKVEKAGLKTYTHVAETKEGKRIRVRTGPYASRAEADKAAEKIKGLDLPAAILSL